MTLRNQLLIWAGLFLATILLLFVFRADPAALRRRAGARLSAESTGELAAEGQDRPALGLDDRARAGHHADPRTVPGAGAAGGAAGCRAGHPAARLCRRSAEPVAAMGAAAHRMARAGARGAARGQPDRARRPRRRDRRWNHGNAGASGLTVLNTIARPVHHAGGCLLPADRLGGDGQEGRRPAAAPAPGARFAAFSATSIGRWPG